MTGTGALTIIAVTWLVTGAVVALTMRRRGHDFWVWLVLGTVLGPLSVPLALERARFHPATFEEVGDLQPLSGRFDVLAGIDGSAESAAAVRSALALFGECVTSLTLATVLDYDTAGTYTGAEHQADAEGWLSRAATEIGFEPVETTVLFGRADKALAEFARERGFELVVVGARGHGISEALFGSVTGRLVGGVAVPVLVGPRSEDRVEA